MTNSSTFDLGLDIGFGNVKIVADAKKSNNFPAHATRVNGTHINNVQKIFATPDGGKWLVGRDAIALGDPEKRIVDSQYFHDDDFKTLALYALSGMQHSDKDLRITTGLPVQYFQRYKAEMERKIKGFLPSIVDVRAVPQPMGAWVDILYDWNGKQIRDDITKGRLALIDVGYGTIDAIEVVGGEFNFKRVEQRNEGIGLIYNDLHSHISSKLNKTMNRAEMGQVIADGGTNVKGVFKSLEREIRQSVKNRVSCIISIINDKWKNIESLDRIVITGGGAIVLEAELRKTFGESQLIIPENPALSNAIGFAKSWKVQQWA